MPQLDQIDSFISQIFWLFVAFGIIYFYISKNAAPKINDVIQKRADLITSDIAKAESVKAEIEDITKKFEGKIASAKTNAISAITAANAESAKLYQSEFSAAEQKLKVQYSSSEKEILEATNAAQEDLKKEISGFVEIILEKLAGLKVEKAYIEKAYSKVK